MKPWALVQEIIGLAPIVEGSAGGPVRLHVQRYVYRKPRLSAEPVDALLLLTQFGGAQVQEGEGGKWRARNIPTQSILLPQGTATHWEYTGPIDFACFYFPPDDGGAVARFHQVARSADGPLQFSDALVGTTALQLTNELRKGEAADSAYADQLCDMMIEQAYRALTSSGAGDLMLRHVHFERMQTVLNHIHDNLSGDLSAETLAGLAQVSLPHFRRLFQEATGEAPHRYVLGARLEQARKLLTMTSLPIARIALDCGFSSQSHLTASFRTAHDASPAAFRSAHAKRS